MDFARIGPLSNALNLLRISRPSISGHAKLRSGHMRQERTLLQIDKLLLVESLKFGSNEKNTLPGFDNIVKVDNKLA